MPTLSNKRLLCLICPVGSVYSKVTSHAKTYTNGFVLNGQKPTANQRVANGFSNGFNGFLNAFNGCAKTFNGL